MAQLAAATAVSRAGLNLETLDVAAAGGGDLFANTGVEMFYVRNGSGASITVTFATDATVDSQAVGDRAVVVPAGNAMLIGPFPTSIYNNVDGNVAVTYSGVTSLTVGVVKPGV